MTATLIVQKVRVARCGVLTAHIVIRSATTGHVFEEYEQEYAKARRKSVANRSLTDAIAKAHQHGADVVVVESNAETDLKRTGTFVMADEVAVQDEL